MAHTIREKTKLLNRVRRIRGQIEAVERALEAEKMIEASGQAKLIC
jgi:DNA-binding FrmR family transcriptional regulator